MAFRTNTSADDLGWRESGIEQCVSQLYIKSVRRTGPEVCGSAQETGIAEMGTTTDLYYSAVLRDSVWPCVF